MTRNEWKAFWALLVFAAALVTALTALMVGAFAAAFAFAIVAVLALIAADRLNP